MLSLGMLTVIFFNVNPKGGSATVFLGIFSFLWIFVSSLIILVGSIFFKKDLSPTMFRRSAITATALIGLLVLSSFDVLNPLSIISFLIAMILTEIYFSSRELEKN